MTVSKSPSLHDDNLVTDPDNVAQATADLLDDPTARELANIFKVLADPTRVRMISALAHTELCVNDLAAVLDMEQSAVSHQLRVLREWRLVKRRQVGRQAYYSLDDAHVHDMLYRSLEHLKHR